MSDLYEQYESNVRSYCRRFPAVFDKAQNDIITDTDGHRYIDFFCGAGACNYGHNNEYIRRQVIDYLESDGIMHAMDMHTKAKGEFIESFEKKVLEPRGLHYKTMFTGPTGTNAIEAALKLARKVTGRTEIFSLMGCFHGMTLGALSLTTEKFARDGAGVPLPYVTHIPAPYMFPGLDVIQYIRTLLEDDHSGADTPAAFVVEAVQAEGGIYVMSAQ